MLYPHVLQLLLLKFCHFTFHTSYLFFYLNSLLLDIIVLLAQYLDEIILLLHLLRKFLVGFKHHKFVVASFANFAILQAKISSFVHTFITCTMATKIAKVCSFYFLKILSAR